MPPLALDPRFQMDESQSEGEAMDHLDIDMNELDEDVQLSGGSDEEELSGSNSEGDDLSGDDDSLDWDLNTFQEEAHKDSSKKKTLSADKLSKFQSRIDASGVVYLSRIPPFMKPIKLRSLLAKYGKLGRIYLAPEDSKVAAKRKKYKHNKRVNYTEGWVEFLDKKVARSTAAILNNTTIGGKKRSYYYDDIWTLKYLPRFKWSHLTEQIAYELKVREQKMKTELAQTKRENKIYIKNVEKAKMIQGMKEKREAKEAKKSQDVSVPSAPPPVAAAATTPAMDMSQIKRRFKQRKIQDSSSSSKKESSDQSKASSVFSRIFA